MARPPKLSRQQIVERDEGKCWICHQTIDLSLVPPHPLSLTIDHIVPKHLGGTSNSKNMAASHKICNETKSDKMPCEYLSGIEGLLYRANGRSAILIKLDSDEDLCYVVDKLSHTRNKSLKSKMLRLRRELDTSD